MKNQILINSHKELFDEVKEVKEMAIKSCIRIWNSSDQKLEDFGIETMACLEEESTNELKLKDVTKHRDTSKDMVNQLKQIDKDSFHKYLVNPINLNTWAKDYVKKIEQEIKRDVVTKLCDGEMQLKNMKLDRLEEVHKKFKLWTTYMEKKRSKGLVS
jgi:hypothetical protein